MKKPTSDIYTLISTDYWKQVVAQYWKLLQLAKCNIKYMIQGIYLNKIN